MAHREIDGLLLRDALFQTLRGNLHQQLASTFLVWQFEISPHHLREDELIVEDVRLFQRSPRHQIVLLRDRLQVCGRGWGGLLLHIHIERYSLFAESHVWISRDIYRPVNQRLRCVEGNVELGIVSLSGRSVQQLVELLDFLFGGGQAASVVRQQFSTTDNFHTTTTCP